MEVKVKEVNVENPPDMPTPTDGSDLMSAAEEGLKVGLTRWHEVCPCCFSEAYPGGLEQAVDKLKG